MTHADLHTIEAEAADTRASAVPVKPDLLPANQRFGIAQPVRRREDIRFITGTGTYTDDIDLPGQAHAAFLRSEHAHGEIRGIALDAARTAPGVIGIFTGADLAAANVGCIPFLRTTVGFDPIDTPHPALALGRVRHVGQPIVLVVAETQAQAADAVELIVVDIDPLPAVTDIDSALAPGAPAIWPQAPDNVALRWSFETAAPGNSRKVTAAFGRAAHVTRLRLNNNRLFANSLEPRSCIASYEPERARYSLVAGGQGVLYFMRVLADQVFKVSRERMRIRCHDVGGGFGAKEQPYPEDVALLHSAKALGRPIKWRGTRREHLLSDNHAREARIDCALALDADGKFLAIRADLITVVGAYFACNGGTGSIRNTVNGLPLVYSTPEMDVSARILLTNTAPIGPYRGNGREQAALIVERLIDQAARETGIDRIALRRRNFIPASAMPYTTPAGRHYDSGEFEAVMDQALALGDWHGFAERAAASAAKGRLRGQGIACFLENVGSALFENAIVRFEPDGVVSMVVATQSQGQGHETSFAQVVADRLGLPTELIRIAQGDSDDISKGHATTGSRSMIMAGSAIALACDLIVEKARLWAAHFLEVSQRDLVFADGVFRVAGTDRAVALVDIARRVRSMEVKPADLPADLDGSGDYTAPDFHFPNGCHICEVEIDPETGTVVVDRYAAVDDVGVMINPMIVHGQVQGGVAQGIGQVVMEEIFYDPDGQLLTGSLMDYALPRADDLPSIETGDHPVPCPKNPLGVKGSGECGVSGSVPAVANAVIDALSRAGAATDIAMPFTSEKIWRALRARPAKETAVP